MFSELSIVEKARWCSRFRSCSTEFCVIGGNSVLAEDKFRPLLRVRSADTNDECFMVLS